MSETLRTADREGLRTLTMSRGKANPLDHPFTTELLEAVRAAAADDSVRALVLGSASPKVFSGGFDLVAFADADEPTFEAFVRTVEELFLELFLFPKPCVAALRGHAIAGGALVAGAFDFRIAAEGPGRIGLPELALGVIVPPVCVEALRQSFGERALMRLCLTAEALPFADALALGVIDRIVPPESLAAEAESLARRLAEADPATYAAMKRTLRAPAAERAEAIQAAGRRAFVGSWFSEAGRRGVAAARAKLAG